MKVIKKLNNNAAICCDGNNQELIAIGKGIGFPKTPYELLDMNKVDMTFYRVNEQTISLISSIPSKIISVSIQLVKIAQATINNSFSTNIVFSLADHINFAIERVRNNQTFDFSLSYDIEHLYPKEYELGIKAIQLINKELNVRLPKGEVTAIALHFINSKETSKTELNQNITENLLLLVTNTIEKNFNLVIDKKSFAFNRFKIHFKYYLQRLRDGNQISEEISPDLMKDIGKGYKKIYKCAVEIVNAIDERLHVQTTDDELFYLAIYINRMINKVGDSNNG